jgi:hypothetical protein
LAVLGYFDSAAVAPVVRLVNLGETYETSALRLFSPPVNVLKIRLARLSTALDTWNGT